MSISAAAPHSAIWNSAASALTNAPQASSIKPNDASSAKGKGTSLNIAGSNPFDALSQSSQFALIQAQAARLR